MSNTASQLAIRITVLTALLTTLLAMLKLTFGWWGQSHALIADGIHSISDVLVDILVLFAAHYGGKQADINHPYGHGRIETAGTFGLALLLIFAGIGIILNVVEHLLGHAPVPKPDFFVLWIAVLAIVINEGLFRYTLSIAKKIQSSLLEANAWHSRSDVAVSIVVLLSIGGALLGFPYLDAVGATIVGVMIIHMAMKLAWRSISELVDTGVDKKTIENIEAMIKAVPGVNTLHMLRTRTVNNKIFLDVHILVEPRISVSEGHYIGEQVIHTLYKNIAEIGDITLHVDPEDDEIHHSSVTLPNREPLITELKNYWRNLPGNNAIQDIRLHYLSGKVEIEIYLSVNFIMLSGHTIEELTLQYTNAIHHLEFVQAINLWAG
jgi:cation diffusion facilitator family transporter